jgi:hypothetical protein
MRNCGDDANSAYRTERAMAGYPHPYPDPYRPPPPARVPSRPNASRLLVPAAIGAAVAVGLGVFGRVHHPSQIEFEFGFSRLLAMKVWFASGAGLFALLQLFSALWLWRRLPFGAPPSWLGPVHRVSGTLAFLLSLPVAYACLYALGFEHTTLRVLLHSLLGCVFYGAFVTKLIVLRVGRLPGWSLPVVGGLLFAALIGVVFTSAVYTFATQGSPGF